MKTIIGATLLALTVSLTPQTQLTPEIEQPLERISTKATIIEQGDFKPVALASAKVVRSEPEKPTQGTQTSNASGSVESLIVKWANHYGNDPDFMMSIARCESTLGANLINPNYTAADGSNPQGVFQFIRSTWLGFGAESGISNSDERMNNAKNIQLANWAFANGKRGHWEC